MALGAAEQTRGLVDPSIGAALEAAGYDRNFAELRPDERPPGASSPGLVAGARHRRRDPLPRGGHEARPERRRQGQDRRRRARGARRHRLRRRRRRRRDPRRLVAACRLARSVAHRPRRDRDERRDAKRLAPRRRGPAPPDRPGLRTTRLVALARGQRRGAGSCLAADIAAKTAFLLYVRRPRTVSTRAGWPGRFVGGEGVRAENRAWPS